MWLVRTSISCSWWSTLPPSRGDYPAGIPGALSHPSPAGGETAPLTPERGWAAVSQHGRGDMHLCAGGMLLRGESQEEIAVPLDGGNREL
ncbi:hypothetical protein BJ875DRAFT_59369 [Amylocarpus encephaloides]|uniref:Uncharacterized protein n=1 Tax=Amylocarpus encephaloides TaxID=45428 RepID=A0A9P8C4D0_9HELO|nr:hypothetical protein BJ875DRAFT_59369 [Amylocarpus encephaloides]